jgi:hypothetical protein
MERMVDVDGACEGVNKLSIRDGFVYLVFEANIDPKGPFNYKIGQSEDPEKRLPALQTGNPRRLIFKWKCAVNDMSAAEKSAKQALVQYRCTLGGGTEWYTAGPDKMVNLIQKFQGAVANSS